MNEYASIHPLEGRVILRRDKAITQTAQGIVLAPGAVEKPSTCQVVSVGPGRPHPVTGARVLPCVHEGDSVLIQKWAGAEVPFNGETLLIIEDIDILARLEPHASVLPALSPSALTP